MADTKERKKGQPNNEKSISLQPLTFDEAVSDLLKVKPEGKSKQKKREKES
jgi:hypothetical protein